MKWSGSKRAFDNLANALSDSHAFTIYRQRGNYLTGFSIAAGAIAARKRKYSDKFTREIHFQNLYSRAVHASSRTVAFNSFYRGYLDGLNSAFGG